MIMPYKYIQVLPRKATSGQTGQNFTLQEDGENIRTYLKCHVALGTFVSIFLAMGAAQITLHPTSTTVQLSSLLQFGFTLYCT